MVVQNSGGVGIETLAIGGLGSQKPVVRHFPDIDSDAGHIEKVFLGVFYSVAVVILINSAGNINSNILDSVETEVPSINN